MRRHLDVPAEVDHATESLELVRAFAADSKLHVALAWDAWPEAGNWGILLVDLARHVANAREQELGGPAAQTLAEIRLAFEGAWGWEVTSVEGAVSEDG